MTGGAPGSRISATGSGARYLTRSDNAHAKAGNINAALKVLNAMPDPPDFVAVLDADFVPHRDFLDRALALFTTRRSGLVQTPQHFFNPDPIQHNLGSDAPTRTSSASSSTTSSPPGRVGPRLLLRHLLGMRWSALEAIGGFPVGSVTEDYLITLRLREEGYSTAYLNEPLTEGLAPEGLGEYITQRGRWCLGLMQIIRGRWALSRAAGCGCVTARAGGRFLYWATTYPLPLACLATPLPTGSSASRGGCAGAGVLSYFLPYFAGVLIVLNWISGGLIVPVLNDVSQLLGAREITKAVLIGCCEPKGPQVQGHGQRAATARRWSCSGRC
jgi:cellulose synthase (UDP-forming)